MRRLWLAAVIFVVASHGLSALEVRTPRGTLALKERDVAGEAWVCAQDLARALGGGFGHDDISKYPYLSIAGKRILLSTHTALASVGEKIIHLQHVPAEKDGCLWLPSEFLTRVLPEVLGGPVSISESAKGQAALKGEAGPPKTAEESHAAVQIELLAGSDLVRVTLTGSAAAVADIRQAKGAVTVSLPMGRFAPYERHIGQGIVENAEVTADGRLLTVTTGTGFRHLESLKLRAPDRLVLIFKGENQVVAAEAPQAQEGAAPQGGAPGEAGSASAPGTAAPARTRAFDLVVLDPGHGGSDTGALGPDGLEEKDLTLAIAQKVAAELEKQGLRVILTRTTDTLVPLVQRTAIANFNQADLFVSIHLNSSPAPSARGTETYYMSRQATDLWASQLADKENAAGGGSVPPDGGLDLVLWQLAQTSSMVESAALAETIQQEFNSLLGTADRGVRQAPFVVLEGATMPSVLVEVAFLSNPGEAKKLADPAFQDQVASALAKSIVSFKARYDSPVPSTSP